MWPMLSKVESPGHQLEYTTETLLPQRTDGRCKPHDKNTVAALISSVVTHFSIGKELMLRRTLRASPRPISVPGFKDRTCNSAATID